MKKLFPTEYKKYALGVLFLFILYNLYKVLKLASSAVRAGANTVAIKTITGLTSVDIATSKSVALDAYDSIYNYSFGMFEDERGFIDALNRLKSAPMAKAASMFYAEMPKGTSLKADMVKYLLPIEYKDISSLVRSNIQ